MTLPAWVEAYLAPGERILWWGKPSPVSLIPATLAGLVSLAFLLWRSTVAPDRGIPLLPSEAVGVVVLAGAVLRIARRALASLFTVYVVTEGRVAVLTSLATREARSIPLARVSTVLVEQGPLTRLLGAWTASITGTGRGDRGIQVLPVRNGGALRTVLGDALDRSAGVPWLSKVD